MSKRGELPMRQAQLLTFLEAHFARHHYAPLVKEMAAAMNNVGNYCVYRALRALRDKGFLTMEKSMARTIKLTSGVSGGEQHTETGVHYEHP